MVHPLYESTASCPDIESLRPQADDGPTLDMAEVAPDLVVAAVRAEQARGGRLEEKVDGCWCAIEILAGGILGEAVSRANLRLRQAAYWEGVRVDSRFVGWTIIGELEAGTTRAKRRREEERAEELGEELHPIHVYALVDPSGHTHDGDACAALVGQLVPLELAGRMRPVRAALPGEDWGDFAERVFASGGEGVIIRRDGQCWRAKPQVDEDRYVSRVVAEPDRRGRMRLKAVLSVCISAGERPRYQETQRVELPKGVGRKDITRRVVTIIGASMDRDTGVVRHARITEIREDKAPWECKGPGARNFSSRSRANLRRPTALSASSAAL